MPYTFTSLPSRTGIKSCVWLEVDIFAAIPFRYFCKFLYIHRLLYYYYMEKTRFMVFVSKILLGAEMEGGFWDEFSFCTF